MRANDREAARGEAGDQFADERVLGAAQCRQIKPRGEQE